MAKLPIWVKNQRLVKKGNNELVLEFEIARWYIAWVYIKSYFKFLLTGKI